MPQDIREGSNLIFELKRSTPVSREPSESDLSCKLGSNIMHLTKVGKGGGASLGVWGSPLGLCRLLV